MLHFNNYQKSYGSHSVLSIENLTLDSGIYWLKGVNGSGKSTLLKSIGGFLSFNGEIIVDQTSLKKQGVNFRQKVNFADAEPMYPEFLTGWEMIEMYKQVKDGPKSQEQYFVDGMNMQVYLSNPLGTYSSGMLKKLSIVLAFIGSPKLILLDEPLITIDTESLKVLYQWILLKHREENISFILSSHQPLEIGHLPELKEISIEGKKLIL